MTQITRDQQEQLRVVAEQVATKIETFHAGLTAEEQLILDVALRHATARATETDDDVAGYLGPVGIFIAGAIAGGLVYDVVKAAGGALFDGAAGFQRPSYERGNKV